MTSSRNNLSSIREMSDSLKSLDDNDKKIYSKNDLNNHLNEIKNVLRDKERDLSLAAEIGQQLLEANTVLKKAYEELFIQNQDGQKQLQDAQKQLRRYEQLTEVHSGRSSPVQSNSRPLSPRFTAMRSRTNSPTPPRSRRGSRNLSLPPSVRLDGTGNSSPSSSLARSNESSESETEDNNNNSLKEQYFEKIKYLENSLNNLERHNEELRALLEKKKDEVKDIQIQNSKLLLIKDGEVYDLKQELEALMIKTKKLELEKKTLTKENQRQANELDRIETIDQEYIQDLLVKISRLDSSLKKMESTKEELERNIENVMVEKLEYQEKCKTLDKKLQDYLYYKHLHDTQAQHIQELNQTIEQQRMQIQNLDFQLYNLSMTPFGNKAEIKYSEKYLLENPQSIQNSNNSIVSKSSYYASDSNLYDSDTLVITAKRNINGSSNISSVQSSDPELTLSRTNLGKNSLYTELEGTDWYDKKSLKDDSYFNDGRMIQSASDSALNEKHNLLKSRKRRPYHHQYKSSNLLSEKRKQSDSTNGEGLILIDKANQSFNNKNIEKMIKPQILLKNDVNSYEVLINTIENEFKNSEEIQTEEHSTTTDNDKENEKTIIGKLDSTIEENSLKEDKDKIELNNKKDTENTLELTTSSMENSNSSKTSLTDKNKSMIDDTKNENNQSNNKYKNINIDTNTNTNSNNNVTSTYSKPKLTFPSISNPKTLALIKHSNVPLFDYKKLSNMIENDQNLNPQPPSGSTATVTLNTINNSNNMKKSFSEEIPQKPNKPQNPFFQDRIRRMSFDSLFRAFELSKFQSTHLLTDSNYSSNSKNRKSKKNINSSTILSTDSNNTNSKEKMNSNLSILNSVAAALSNSNSSSISIQEIDDDDIDTNVNNTHIDANTNTFNTNSNISINENINNNTSILPNTTTFFMPKPSSMINSPIIPINSKSNKEFNNLIKNFHLASPITPLIANINLNNAIKEEAAHTNISELSSNTQSKGKSKSRGRSKTRSFNNVDNPKAVISLKNKPLFSSSKKLLSPKMDLSLIYKEDKNDTPSTINSNSNDSNNSNNNNNNFNSNMNVIDSSSSSSVTFKNPDNLQQQQEASTTNNYPGGDLFSLLKEKQNQNIANGNMEEIPGNYNGIFTNTVNGSSILSSNVIMNNQVMLDQYRNTLNHYSNSGSAILQVLIDSWLRFLNGFVGYGSNINYDINNMDYNNGTSPFQQGYSYERRKSSFSEDSFDPSDTTSPTSTTTSATTSATSSTNNIKALSQSIRSKRI